MMTLTSATAGSSFAPASADPACAASSTALSWVASQLRFERLLRTLEQETEVTAANPSDDAQ